MASRGGGTCERSDERGDGRSGATGPGHPGAPQLLSRSLRGADAALVDNVDAGAPGTRSFGQPRWLPGDSARRDNRLLVQCCSAS